jgi:hypothetical protein
MKKEGIKSVQEKESISLALQVSKQAKVKEIRVVKVVRTDRQISEETDLDKVAAVNKTVEASKTVEEAISNHSNVYKRQSLLQKKSKTRSSKPWRDFRAISLEARPSLDVISVLKETEMSKWREMNPKSSRLRNSYLLMTLLRS